MKKLTLISTLALCATLAFPKGTQDSQKTTVLKFSASTGGTSATSPMGQGMATFAKKVAEYTQGSIQIEVFYDTTLGSPSSMVNGLQLGTVDFGVCGDAYYSSLVPEIQAFELPYMFDSLKEARSAVAGPAGEMVMKKIRDKGILPLNFWEIGFRQLTTSKRPVSTPTDLKGLKIRTLPSTFQVKAWESAGAIPVPMDVSELYASLQQGVVDGQENPLSEIYNQRFYEVQKHLSLTDHVYTPMLFSASESAWERLNEAQRDAIKQAAADAQETVYRLNDEARADYLRKIVAAGVEVIENPDRRSFKKVMEKVQGLFEKEYGTELLQLLKP